MSIGLIRQPSADVTGIERREVFNPDRAGIRLSTRNDAQKQACGRGATAFRPVPDFFCAPPSPPVFDGLTENEVAQKRVGLTDEGIRSLAVMDEILASGDADLLSLCRPLIREPDLPNRLRSGEATASACISGGRCWPKGVGLGVRCRCEG